MLILSCQVVESVSTTASSYRDRAAERREKDTESTVVSSLMSGTSVEVPLTSNHKGFQLLAKLGWKAGEGLGKDRSGTTEPVAMLGNAGRSGVGVTGAVSVVDGSADVVDDKTKMERSFARRAAIRDLTVKRYAEADLVNDDDVSTGGVDGVDSVPMPQAGAAPVSFKMNMKKKPRL